MTARVRASSNTAAVSVAAAAAATLDVADAADAADAERQPQREAETPAAVLTPGGGRQRRRRRRQQTPGPQGRRTQLAPALRQPQGRRADQPRRNACCGPVSYSFVGRRKEERRPFSSRAMTEDVNPVTKKTIRVDACAQRLVVVRPGTADNSCCRAFGAELFCTRGTAGGRFSSQQRRTNIYTNIYT